jgi:hypothetical protein
MRATPAAALLLALLGPAPARAHVRLVQPVSRYGDEMKVGPCGRLGGTRSANVTTYAPGSTIAVVFDEIIQHPGWYRIAFDPAGDGALGPPAYDGARWSNPPGVQVLADLLPDPPSGIRSEVQVTLPDVECDACTLQLIQVMTDKPPFDGGDDFYFQCADLRLVRGVPPPSQPPPPPPAAAASAPAGGCGAPGAEASLLALLPLALARRGSRREGAP